MAVNGVAGNVPHTIRAKVRHQGRASSALLWILLDGELRSIRKRRARAQKRRGDNCGPRV